MHVAKEDVVVIMRPKTEVHARLLHDFLTVEYELSTLRPQCSIGDTPRAVNKLLTSMSVLSNPAMCDFHFTRTMTGPADIICWRG